MITHYLKCWPEYFQAILERKKTFELRRNDRDYKVGDILVLQEYDIKAERYTGRSTCVGVEYILDVADGLQRGYIIMSIGTVEMKTEG